jgi:hypothetical protein
VIFDKTFFVRSFLHVDMHIFFLLCHNLHSFKVLHTKWCSPHYVCIMWIEMIEKFNAPKNEQSIIFLNVLPMFFLFWLFYFFFICVLIIWLSFMHNIILMQHMFYDLNPFIPLQTCFKQHGYSSFKREEKDLNIQTLYIC